MPAPDGSTPRALPALAGIAAKLAPTILKLAPKLAKGSKLTNVRCEQMAPFGSCAQLLCKRTSGSERLVRFHSYT